MLEMAISGLNDLEMEILSKDWIFPKRNREHDYEYDNWALGSSSAMGVGRFQ